MLKTFSKGGIHPSENKWTSTIPIESVPLPKTVSIPVTQHLGAPAKVLVNKGDTVKVGQQIAKTSGFISANIHSSVSGTVSKIDDVIDSSGYRRQAVVIDVKDDEWEEGIDRSSNIKREITASADEIRDKILSLGIVGLGGATFPTHVKFLVPEGKSVKYLVINGVECEPCLTSDHRLMLERSEEIIVGIQVSMKALKVSKAIIGIENNKEDAVKLLQKLVENIDEIEVVPLKVQYPQGGEKQLIKALLGLEVPSGGLPLNVGVVVQNVGTIYAIYQAVQKNRPLVDRVVTVTGESLKKRGNFWVRLGTSVKDLLDHIGEIPNDTVKIISGGPMMGKALTGLDVPVVKGMSGILIITENDTHCYRRGKEGPCIRCARCISVCPMGLEPNLLGRLSKKNYWEEMELNAVMDCMECGCCSFTCPANIFLLDHIRIGKSKVSNIIRSRK